MEQKIETTTLDTYKGYDVFACRDDDLGSPFVVVYETVEAAQAQATKLGEGWEVLGHQPIFLIVGRKKIGLEPSAKTSRRPARDRGTGTGREEGLSAERDALSRE